MVLEVADVGRQDPTQELNERLHRRIAEETGPVSRVMPTPAEALAYKIKLPWDGKVAPAKPADLHLALFNNLIDYGLSRTQIMHLFSLSCVPFYALLNAWSIPPGKRGRRKTEAPPELPPTSGFSLAGWEEILPHAKPGNPFLFVNKGKSYLSAGAAEFLQGVANVTVLLRPDGGSVAIKAGGNISIKSDNGKSRRLQLGLLTYKLLSKGIILPVRFILRQEGEYLIGELKS